MATTTNYAWETPDDTDLVKDGAAAIRTLGSSIDTTTKALNPSTTLGDIEYRSATANTNTRLPIGTSGQILAVNGSGVPAWTAAPQSGGMTLLSTTTFSTGTVSLTSISADYVDLVLVISEMYGSSDGAELDIQFNTNTGANYGIQRGTTLSDGQTSIRVNDMITTSVQYEKQCNGMIVIPRYASNMRKFCQIRLSASAAATDLYSNNQGFFNNTGAISSIQLKTSAGTFSGGTVFLYGVK
jgi:hypothetical protein